MSSDLPSFLAPSQTLPSFLAPPAKPTREFASNLTKETREFQYRQCELAFPRVIDRMYGGETLNKILEDFPLAVDRGIFMRWIKKDAERFAIYTEAKETRTEIWTGEIMKIALGEETVPMELDRAKFLVDTYKFLIRAENKKGYGDTKEINLNQTVSISAAFEKAQTRVQQIASFSDEDETEPSFKQLSEVIDVEYEETDDDD